MKILYLDASCGCAGDMFAGALFDLLEKVSKSDAAKTLSTLQNIGLSNVVIDVEDASANSICAKHFKVCVNGVFEDDVVRAPREHAHSNEHAREHAHSNEHAHEHAHGRTLSEVLTIIDELCIPENVRENAAQIYNLIASAEAKAHGCAEGKTGEVHFHEVGMYDAIVDIVASCLLVHALAPDVIVASPINVGSGIVNCAHGTLPVPAPATANLLEGMQIYGQLDAHGNSVGERCTPTGAALLRFFSSRQSALPLMTFIAQGRGKGSRYSEEGFSAFSAIMGDAIEQDSDRGIIDNHE